MQSFDLFRYVTTSLPLSIFMRLERVWNARLLARFRLEQKLGHLGPLLIEILPRFGGRLLRREDLEEPPVFLCEPGFLTEIFPFLAVQTVCFRFRVWSKQAVLLVAANHGDLGRYALGMATNHVGSAICYLTLGPRIPLTHGEMLLVYRQLTCRLRLHGCLLAVFAAVRVVLLRGLGRVVVLRRVAFAYVGFWDLVTGVLWGELLSCFLAAVALRKGICF